MVEDLFESAIRQDINGVLKENGWNSFSDKTLLNMKKKSLIEIIRMLENNWCCSIERHKNTIAYAEDIKANCDLAIEGRDIKIDELEEKNSYMFDTIALQEQQIEKMKCCANCEKYFVDCKMEDVTEEEYFRANAFCKHWELRR